MQTATNQSSDNNGRKRTLILGVALGAAAAALFGAGLVFGTGRGASKGAGAPPAEAGVIPSATARPGSPGAPGQVTVVSGNGGGDGEHAGGSPETTPTATAPAAEPTEAPTEAATETPTATPTATPEPGGVCVWCLDPGIIIPLPTEPACAFCFDGDLIGELDVSGSPDISGIGVNSFCYPILMVEFAVDEEAETWVSYNYDAHEYESYHLDVEQDVTSYIALDTSDLGWGVYLVGSFFVHAVDSLGNHTVSPPAGFPEPDLAC